MKSSSYTHYKAGAEGAEDSQDTRMRALLLRAVDLCEAAAKMVPSPGLRTLLRDLRDDILEELGLHAR